MREKPVDVAAAATYHSEKGFLVMKRAETMEVNPGKWDFPSGKVEDEEEPRKAALRELREETGLTGEIIRTGESFVQETPDGTFTVHPFLVLVQEGKVRENTEHTEHRWVEKQEIGELDTVPGLEKDLQKVGVLDD